MTIELNMHQGAVKEWLINYTINRLMELHRKDAAVSAARVHFKVHANGSEEDKVCEIDCTIYGYSVFVHRTSVCFEQASREAIAELSRNIDEHSRIQNEPPDQVVSTVKV